MKQKKEVKKYYLLRCALTHEPEEYVIVHGEQRIWWGGPRGVCQWMGPEIYSSVNENLRTIIHGSSCWRQVDCHKNLDKLKERNLGILL